MPQFFFFDLLLISSMSSPGALADYHSLHLLSGSKGSGKENRGSGRGQTQGEVLGRGGSAEPLAFTALVRDAAGCCRAELYGDAGCHGMLWDYAVSGGRIL